jgi:urate oxidase
MDRNYACSISYGKLRIPLYRVYARPLAGIRPISESRFSGRTNTLFALEVDVEVFGKNFLPAYTEGDNSNVVATDSMKNFVLRQALAFEGATLEALLAFLGERFLATYAQMESLRLTARELPFVPVLLPGTAEDTSRESQVLFSRSHNDFALAAMDFARDEKLQVVITAHRCGRLDLELFKMTGSAFTRFVQDEYTTLPERVDRPLFIHLDVYWTYTDGATLSGSDYSLYVPAEQVRDLIQVVFDEFVSESIQHLVYELGCRLLERFTQLASVSFDAQNRTRELVATAPGEEKARVYTDPFTAFGTIKLVLSRSTEGVIWK